MAVGARQVFQKWTPTGFINSERIVDLLTGFWACWSRYGDCSEDSLFAWLPGVPARLVVDLIKWFGEQLNRFKARKALGCIAHIRLLSWHFMYSQHCSHFCPYQCRSTDTISCLSLDHELLISNMQRFTTSRYLTRCIRYPNRIQFMTHQHHDHFNNVACHSNKTTSQEEVLSVVNKQWVFFAHGRLNSLQPTLCDSIQ